MVAVGCMKKHDIAVSGALGCALFPLCEMAKLTPFSGLLLTLSGELFPIPGILFSPFRVHNEIAPVS